MAKLQRIDGTVIAENDSNTVAELATDSRADLRKANLSGADLRKAYLSRAELSGADLSGADLSRADLREANLSGADLSRADLREANLSGADLREADLSGADLSGADLREANLLDGGQDSRGYRFTGWLLYGELQILAGCRNFTLLEAREHWGSFYNGGQAQGAECLARVELIATLFEARKLNKKANPEVSTAS